MNEDLVTSIEVYLRFVDRDSVSDERSIAHDEMMWLMRQNGFEFVDRIDAMYLAVAIRDSDYAIEWIIYNWHNVLKGQK